MVNTLDMCTLRYAKGDRSNSALSGVVSCVTPVRLLSLATWSLELRHTEVERRRAERLARIVERGRYRRYRSTYVSW